MKHIVWVLLLALSVTTARGMEVAGVELPAEITLYDDGQVLQLNGVGIREKFFLDIYLASLYLSERESDAGRILAADAPRRVQMDMLYAKVDKEKFVDGWNEGFAANQSDAAMRGLRERLMRFNAMFETLIAGDRVILDYTPGIGTRVIIKGEDKGVIPGLDFNRALLSVWLGDKPVTRSLKKALLTR